ncbi:C40 family peptidase [Nesterenkonia sp. MY13]|uniref:C40 family peptidase n=1 Tax=Nesterenkonia sedimenti TaxID=1463632 RepID=A0A7X8YEN8_9MICC|nr:C40 family peptidase [Nesterenkonia sedimenti]NLS11018.1 C40 family peptidase [Nesterenkonia sedimenti]
MKHRRNLAVAAVTAVVVTTALVGTTLPDLVADRTGDAVAEQSESEQNLADNFVVTELPDTPSAKEIATAKESDQAREKLMADIAGRINQASERANELESELQRQQSLAASRMAEAAEAAEAAEQATLEAEAALAMDAYDDYQEEDSSAADVLLGDEGTLAEDATDQQREEQAEQAAVEAEQAAREAEAERERAEAAAQETAEDLENLGEGTAETRASQQEVGANLREQLEALRDLEGWEGSFESFLENFLGNADFLDEDGEIDEEQLAYRIQQLRADAEQTQVTAAAAEAADFDSLTEEQRELLAAGAEVDGVDSVRDYYELVLDNSNFTSSTGAVNWDAVAAHVDHLESQAEADETEQEEPSAAPSPSSTPSPSATPSPTETPSPSATPTRSATSSTASNQSSPASFDSLSSAQRELLAEAGELESGSNAEDYYRMVLDNSNFTTSGGSVNWTVLEGHLSYLQAQEEAEEQAEEEAEAAPSLSPTPSPSQSSSPSRAATQQSSTPSIPSWGNLSSSMQSLLSTGAELEPGFSGSGGDYYRAVLNNPDLTTGDGRVSQNALQWHVNYLESQNTSSSRSSSGSSSSSSPSPTQSATPTPTQTPTPTPTPTQTQTQTANPQPASGGGSNAAQIAMDWAVNTANRSDTYYRLGGNGPNAWDCSSFTQAAYAAAGVSLGRTTYDQITQGRQVPWDERQPGDLIFWGDYHMAIYLGDGRIADAGSPSSGVTVRSIFGSPTSVRRVT